MAKISTSFIFLLAASNLNGMVNGELEQVMKQGELPLDFHHTFQDGHCRVAMKSRGSLVVSKGKENMELMWQTGLAPGHASGDEYVLQLKEKGNISIKRTISPDGQSEGVTVYDTHTDGSVGEYFLGINEACVLEIYEGSLEEPGDLIWKNIKTEMKPGDSLGTSEIFFYDSCDMHFMFMNPNGNLEIFEGRDFTDVGDNDPVWESNTKRESGDYQFSIDENAVLSLRDVVTDEQYWKKDLQNSGRSSTSIRDLSLVSFGCEIMDNGVGPYVWFKNEGNLFMREGDKLPSGSVYSSNRCTLFVQYDGRLDLDDSYDVFWTSGKAKDDTAGDDYYLMLHERGNLAMYRGTIDDPDAEILWATHTRGEIGNYFLSTDKDCYLRVFEGTPEEKGKLVWTNHVNRLQSGDRLIKAQGFSPLGGCNAMMLLRPDNGILGVYDSYLAGSLSVYECPECFDDSEAYWTFDAGLGDYDDFYVKVNSGKLKFYGVGKDGDELKGEFGLGEWEEDFEVALCDESGLILPKPIAV